MGDVGPPLTGAPGLSPCPVTQALSLKAPGMVQVQHKMFKLTFEGGNSTDIFLEENSVSEFPSPKKQAVRKEKKLPLCPGVWTPGFDLSSISRAVISGRGQDSEKRPEECGRASSCSRAAMTKLFREEPVSQNRSERATLRPLTGGKCFNGCLGG